jgi:zinc transporter
MNNAPLQTFFFDKNGTAKPGSADAMPQNSIVWVHAQWNHPESEAWLNGPAGLSSVVLDALMAPETRPRCTVINTETGDGVLINLRGVNLHEDSEPEDMISVRIWLEADRVVSAWRRPLFAVQDIIDSINRGHGPLSVGDFTANLALRLADWAEPVVAGLNEVIDTLEETILADNQPNKLRGKLAEARRTAIGLRRYMFPQRDAL